MKRMLSVIGLMLAASLCLAFPSSAADDMRMIEPIPIEAPAAPALDLLKPITVAVCSLAVPLVPAKRKVVATGYGVSAIGASGFAVDRAFLSHHRPHEDPGRMRS